MSDDHWETHCGRCGDEYPRHRESRICESCETELQWSKLIDGVRVDSGLARRQASRGRPMEAVMSRFKARLRRCDDCEVVTRSSRCPECDTKLHRRGPRY